MGRDELPDIKLVGFLGCSNWSPPSQGWLPCTYPKSVPSQRHRPSVSGQGPAGASNARPFVFLQKGNSFCSKCDICKLLEICFLNPQADVNNGF